MIATLKRASCEREECTQEHVKAQDKKSEIAQWELDEVHKIAVRLTTRKLSGRDKSPAEKWFEHAAEWMFSQSKAIVFALAVLMVLNAILGHASWGAVALVFAVLLGLVVIAASFVGIGAAFPFFNRIRKEPYAPMLWSIKAATVADSSELSKLMECRRDVVALYLLQYKHEREAFERRGAMIAGALDKVGFFPAIAAFVGVATSLWAHSEMFVRVLVVVVPAFYLMNFATYQIVQEMTRTVALLEYAVKKLDEKAKESRERLI